MSDDERMPMRFRRQSIDENPGRRNNDERLRRLERLALHDPGARLALQVERLRHGDRRLGALLSAVRVLWIRPWSGSMYGILYSMRPGQSPTDIWRAEWPAWGDRAGKPAEQVPGDWVYLPTVENIQRDLTPEDRQDLLEFLGRHREALPRQVYEWVDLEQFYRPESDHGIEATRNAGRKWRSLAEEFPELIAEWSDKNLPLTPRDVTPGMGRTKVWWICPRPLGHPDYPHSPYSRAIGSICPLCSGVVRYKTSLDEERPGLAAEWSDKNLPRTPGDVTPGSHDVVWWKCAEGHEDYDAPVVDRTNRARGCPKCHGYTWRTLAEACPWLAGEWSDRNFPLTPDDVWPGATKRVWWHCKTHGEWRTRIAHRSGGAAGVLHKAGCPECARERRRQTSARGVVGRKGSSSTSPRRSTRGGSSFDIGPHSP